MNDNIIAALARQATAVSRRGSLRALGGAALAGTLAAPTVARAGKSGKKSGKRCQKQREQCREVFAERCQGSQVCEEAFAPCCEQFAQCRAEAALRCIFAVD